MHVDFAVNHDVVLCFDVFRWHVSLAFGHLRWQVAKAVSMGVYGFKVCMPCERQHV
jgi:hypothetical protein